MNLDSPETRMKEIQSSVGFADGEIVGCERRGNTFTVWAKAWNGKELRVDFKDVQFVQDLIPGDVSGFCMYTEKTEMLEAALDYAYDERPSQHPYKHFVFLNNDGSPCLSVVAAESEVNVG